MSSLKTLEKEAFEELLGMSGGYVLDFSNQSFAAFFRETASISIYDAKYAVHGDSKAKRLRAFWENESDPLVGKVLSELIEIWEYKTDKPGVTEARRVEHCRTTVARLLGRPVQPKHAESAFLERDLSSVSLAGVRIDPNLVPILDARFAEAKSCLQAKAPLATIFHCGSILEGLLLGVACMNPQQFNQATSSPKDATGKVKPFPEWTLAQFIDVACDLGHLKLDVRKFSHALRDFRNYIHPFQQMSSRFNPDRHSAEICLQVLKAAIASLSGSRQP
jgi:hypothetical protein